MSQHLQLGREGHGGDVGGDLAQILGLDGLAQGAEDVDVQILHHGEEHLVKLRPVVEEAAQRGIEQGLAVLRRLPAAVARPGSDLRSGEEEVIAKALAAGLELPRQGGDVEVGGGLKDLTGGQQRAAVLLLKLLGHLQRRLAGGRIRELRPGAEDGEVLAGGVAGEHHDHGDAQLPGSEPPRHRHLIGDDHVGTILLQALHDGADGLLGHAQEDQRDHRQKILFAHVGAGVALLYLGENAQPRPGHLHLGALGFGGVVVHLHAFFHKFGDHRQAGQDVSAGANGNVCSFHGYPSVIVFIRSVFRQIRR